ncbi:hypothetical protein NW752_011886 [Fusarium irregulare]|uniref:Uncharacterized protein n=1 Tax=Fusarium irregulare TaxID=2494466 RepID=A0A9W8PEK8_9HYPO|nr:hypothetical protein NW766_012367 [Fusarium irregulare]KAJ4004272.1 hypothetical protein NW752_011886 [Fusarium irregulare]
MSDQLSTNPKLNTTDNTPVIKTPVIMDTSTNPFTGALNDPNSHANFLGNKSSNSNEALIMGGVMIGSVVLVAIVGVGCMVYKQRVRKMKAQEAKLDDGASV